MARRPPPTTVFFDLDDTLFDHALTCRAALAEVRRAEPRFHPLRLDDLWVRYRAELLRPLPRPLAPRAAGEDDDSARAARFQCLAREAGWTAGEEESRTLSRLYRRSYLRARRPVPGAVSLVRRMARTHPIGVVTNHRVAAQEEKLRFLGLREFIDPLIASEAVGVEKPERAIFAAALRAARARPREAVMVGDSWTNDVLGARAAGIRPIWFNRFGARPPTRHRVEHLASYRPAAEAARIVLGLPGGTTGSGLPAAGRIISAP